MVTMDNNGSSAGLDEDCERPDFRLVAWLLREKLNVLIDGDQGECPELELRNLLNQVASRKIVSMDPKLLNPILWRTLPTELLLLVLARLPVPDITRLRCLSKEWNWDMATVDSDINQACDEASPSMVALLSGGIRNEFFVTILDLSKHRSQYSYPLHMRVPFDSHEAGWETMGAIDGGLVCFVSTWKPTQRNRLCIVVMNLLTRVQRKLPPLRFVYLAPPTMVNIKVDSETKCYKVVVVGKQVKGRPTVEIYDSGRRKWTTAIRPCGSIFGLAYKWRYSNYSNRFKCARGSKSPCVYDFAEQQLKLCRENNPCEGESVGCYVLQKDHMFVLHEQVLKETFDGETLVGGSSITDYQVPNNAKDWVQKKSHLCTPLRGHYRTDMFLKSLSACEGFLMASAQGCGPYKKSCHFWVLDLSTGVWSDLTERFEGLEYETSMCRAFWNVIP